MNKKPSFVSYKDYWNTLAMAGAAYVPFAVQSSLQDTPQQMATHAAVISGMFLGLRIPYIREIPLLTARLLFVPLMVRGRKKASEHIQSLAKPLIEKAGYSERDIKVFTYERGIAENAIALGGNIYLGKKLIDDLNDEEIKFIIGHELSHIRTNDASEKYLFWPPLVNSFDLLVDAALKIDFTTLRTCVFSGGAAIAAFAYFGYQRLLSKSYSRYAEYRADKNAVSLTNSLDDGLSALVKIDGNISIDDIKNPPKNFRLKEYFNMTHPTCVNRLLSLAFHFNANIKKQQKIIDEKAWETLKRDPILFITQNTLRS